MKRLACCVAAILIAAIAPLPSPAALAPAEVTVTAAAKGVFPSGTAYNGVPLSGLRFGVGVEIPGDTSATGEFESTLLGTSALGQPQNIIVEGKASSGSANGTGSATFSGTCTVDMADGTAPRTAVPFTVTITVDSYGKGTITLTLGTTKLSTATVNEGSMAIQ